MATIGLEFEPLQAEFDLALSDPGYVEQIVDDPREVRDLTLEDLPGPCRLRRIRLGAAHDFERESHRRQRVAELVRQRAEKLVLLAIHQTQRFRIDAERFGFPGGGDIVDREQQHASASLTHDSARIDEEHAAATAG